MGYDIHITRRKYWADEGEAIGSDEWLAIIEEDSELSLFPANGPFFAVWRHSDSGDECWLDWYDGNIYTKNPEKPFVEKIKKIANKLRANVQGDDGEIY